MPSSPHHFVTLSRVLLTMLVCLLFVGVAHPTHAAPSTRNPSLVIRLADLGYRDDMLLRGARPVTSFSFPLPEGGINQGSVTLYVQVSPLVSPDAIIMVALNNRPVLSTTIADLGADGVLTVPVEAVKQDVLTVQVSADFLVSDERCSAVETDSLWALITTESQVQYTTQDGTSSIRSFLQLPGGQVQVQGQWDTPQQRADSVALFSTLKHLYRNTPTQVVLIEDAPPAAPGSLTRVVALGGSTSTPLALNGSTLTVAASPAALRELLVQAGQPLLLGRSLTDLSVPAAAEQSPERQSLSFADLGTSTQERSGTGDMPITVRFTLADLGGWARNLRFQLHSTFDPVPVDTLERAFVRVRLNGTLVETFDIRGRSSLQREINLPTTALQPENYLETSFVYAPISGDCLGAPYRFTGQVSDMSSLTWSGYDATRHQLPELISAFRGHGSLYLLDDSAATARAAAHLVGNLSAFTAEPLTPTLADLASLARSTSGYRIVVGGESTVAQTLNLPIDIGQSVVVSDPQTRAVMLQGQPDQPLVSAQYLPGATPTLVVQHSPGADAALLDATIAHFTSPEQFFGLRGNVVVGDTEQIIALNLGITGLQVTQRSSVGTWTDLFSQYRWALLIPAALLITGLWWQAYRRVGQRPPLPENPVASTSESVE